MKKKWLLIFISFCILFLGVICSCIGSSIERSTPTLIPTIRPTQTQLPHCSVKTTSGSYAVYANVEGTNAWLLCATFINGSNTPNVDVRLVDDAPQSPIWCSHTQSGSDLIVFVVSESQLAGQIACQAAGWK